MLFFTKSQRCLGENVPLDMNLAHSIVHSIVHSAWYALCTMHCPICSSSWANIKVPPATSTCSCNQLTQSCFCGIFAPLHLCPPLPTTWLAALTNSGDSPVNLDDSAEPFTQRSQPRPKTTATFNIIHLFTFIQEYFPWRLLDSLKLRRKKRKISGKIENNITKPKSYVLWP